MAENQFFKVKKITKKTDIIADFETNHQITLPRSDLTIEHGDSIIQFEFVDNDDDEMPKFKVGVGTFDLEMTQAGPRPFKSTIRKENLLEEFSNTQDILNEFNKFFDRLDFYEELNLEKRRGLLLYGPPGTGKTKSISVALNKILDNENDACVINWKSDVIRSSDVMTLFSKILVYKKEVKKLIIIIEDIGTNHDGGRSYARSVDSSLLNFLDGVGISFPIPTFIVATTNHPENLTESLLNRPGRFDEWVKVDYPTSEERVKLAEFISNGKITEEDKKVIAHNDCKNMTASHIKELIIRSLRDGISLSECVKKMQDHQKEFMFIKSRGMGI